MTSPEIIAVATDVATYVGAVSAGVSANALTDSAKALVEKIRHRVPAPRPGELLTVTEELVQAVAALLEADAELRSLATQVVGPTSIDRSIVISAQSVSGVTQHNH